MTLQDWLQASGINYQGGDSPGQPGSYTNANGQPLWDAANPMYGGVSRQEDMTPEQYMQSIYQSATNPSYGSQGLSYNDMGGGTGFFNGARDGSYARIGDNLANIQNDPRMMQYINANGGLASMTRNDPTYGMEFDTSNPAYQQMSNFQTQKNAGYDNGMSYWLAALGGFAGPIMGAAAAGGSAAVGEGAAAGATAAGEAGGSLAGGGMDLGFDFGSSGLTEGALASDAGFVPGSFDLGLSGYGGTAAAGLDAAAAEASPWYQGLVQKYGTDAAKSLLSQVMKPGTGGSALGNIFGGNGGAQDYASLLGSLGSSALGYMGAQSQANNYNAMQQKYLDMGQPYRDKLQASYAPGFDMAQADPAYQGAMDQSSNSILRKLSAQGGNPYDNPGGLMEAQKYVTQNTALPQLNTYRSQLGGFGQLGVNTAGTAGMNAVPAQSGTYTALGSGLAGLTNPYGNLNQQNMRINMGY